MVKYLLTILIIVALSANGFAQKHYVGIELGKGKSTVEENGLHVLNPLSNDNSNFNYVGVNYFFIPNNAMFRIKSGINYGERSYREQRFNYIRIPSGLDFLIGKKLKFVGGVGAYFSYLITYQISTYQIEDFEETKNNFQIGIEINFGFEYLIKEKIGISVMYQSNHDGTSMYEDIRTKGGGRSVSRYPNRGYESYFSIGIIYNL